MNVPQIIQFTHGSNTLTNIGPWLNRKTVWKSVYSRSSGEVREFTDTFNTKLIEHFTNNPPKVGDIVYIEAPFRIINVFYNFNHTKYVIWWVYDPLFESKDVIEVASLQSLLKDIIIVMI